jgi:hypothetical protein
VSDKYNISLGNVRNCAIGPSAAVVSRDKELSPEVRRLVKVARFILRDATVNQNGYAVLDRGCDEDLAAALAPFEGQ